jgi:hypothetical protein
VQGDTVVVEYRRETPDGEQADSVDLFVVQGGVIKTPARVSGNAIGGNADYRNARGQRFRGAALMPSELSPSEWHWV